MTAMKSIVIPDGTLLLDTSEKLTPALIAKIKAFRYLHDGVELAPAGILRYLSLHKINTAYDISPDEASMILDNFEYLGVVQHCLAAPPGKTGWTASVEEGALKGTTAAAHADLIGYPSDAMGGYDDEDVSEGDIAGEIGQWCTKFAPRPTLLYVGFAAGLNSAQLWELPNVHAYWSDAGHRSVDNCGVMLQQLPQVSVGGVYFDPNIANADKLGRRVVLATAA